MRLIKLILGSLLFCASLLTYAAEEGPHVRVELLSSLDRVAPGNTFDVIFRQQIDEGWHTYWRNPGDSGDPPSINWQEQAGLTIGEFNFPYPERIPYGPLMNFGYHDQVDLVFTVTVDEGFDDDAVTLKGSGRVLVCEEICIPQRVSVELEIPVGQQQINDEVAAAISTARQKLPVDLGLRADWQSDGESINLAIPLPAGAGSRIESLAYFPLENGQIANTAEQTYTLTADGLNISLMPGYDFDPVTANLSGVLVITEAAGENIVSAFSFSTGDEVGEKPVDDSLSIGVAMLFALLGGLILNLMPCVFPVLSIKVLSLVESAGGHAREIRLHGWVYTLGVVLSFLAIAGVLMALRSAGEAIGWGFQLQSPVVVGLLAYLFFVIGLNLSGLFEIGTSIMSHGNQQQQGIQGSFLTGVLATLVAAPCTAPFMGAAVGFALTQSALYGLLVFGALGVGMALPYLVLCYSPALLKRLPSPGAWMNTFKQVLAFPMFASAIWLLWVLGIQVGATGMMQVLAGMLVIAFGIYLVAQLNMTGMAKLVTRAIALVLVASAVYMVLNLAPSQGAVSTAEVGNDSIASPWSPAAERAALVEGPVFVNFTAAWCITCKVNELNAIELDSVRDAFREKGITYLKGDWTNEDPEITRALETHGRSGVPLYLLYRGEGSEPKVLPQLLTSSIVLDAIAEI